MIIICNIHSNGMLLLLQSDDRLCTVCGSKLYWTLTNLEDESITPEIPFAFIYHESKDSIYTILARSHPAINTLLVA